MNLRVKIKKSLVLVLALCLALALVFTFEVMRALPSSGSTAEPISEDPVAVVGVAPEPQWPMFTGVQIKKALKV